MLGVSKVEHLLEHGYVLEEGVFTAEDCDEMHAMMELLFGLFVVPALFETVDFSKGCHDGPFSRR